MILPSAYNKIPGQTLFLGASVLSFNSSVGWGGGSSTLQVELIEDFQPTIYANDPHYSATYGNLTTPNHYYLCRSDPECYVDEIGEPYNDNKPAFPDGMRNDPKEKNVPGKIYYKWESNRFVSKYWIYGDPGFFATGTTIPSNGVVPDIGHNIRLNNSTKYVYDIINTPVYFKFGDFEFIGLVKSWERNNKPGGITYSVTIESFDSILENSYVILDSYGGSIFGIPRTMDPASKGSPINLIDSALFNYEGLLSQGNIPNIFNVYGFLESFGINFFGGSNLNSNGLRAVDVLRGISILTSAYQLRETDKAFSPFGRILTKTIADISPPRGEGGTPTQNTVHNIPLLGIIPQDIGTDRYPTNISTTQRIYNTFSLDLSDISNIIPDFRISGSQSIADIIRIVCEASGKDFITKVIPAYTSVEGSSDTTLSQFVIKVISIDKTSYQPPDRIKNIIQNLEAQKYLITNSSFGQESNENYTYNFLIGGPQQRLLQVKNYRLSFNQTNYVYNPILKRFINLNKPWNKARVPDVFSTRNNIISQYIFGEINSSRINAQDSLRYNRFDCAGIDNQWSDNEVSVSVNNKAVRGNYKQSTITNISNNIYGSYGDYFLQTGSKYPCDIFAAIGNLGANQYIDSGCEQDFPNSPCPVKSYGSAPCVQSTNPAEETFENLANYSSGSSSNLGPIGATRFFNLQNDFICPYFGRALEDQMPVNDDTNEFRRVRPVFLDTWTNQITVAFSIRELPSLSIGEPLSLYDNPIFSAGFNNTAPNTSGLQRNSFNQSQPNPRSNISQASRPSPPNLSFNPVLNNIRRSVLNRPGFTIKETEMRAAMAGFDSYLAYCLGKSHFSKPDLFLMLATAYAAKGQLFIDPSKYNGNINNKDDESGLTRKHSIPDESSVVKYNVTTFPQNPLNSKLKNNWNILLNHNFLKDLTILQNFIKDIGDTYYGKQYLVKTPDITIYSDQQYETLSIRSRYSNISVYGGSKRLFYSYEIAKEGAWEEPGNFIDDCMVIGDNFSTVFAGDNGLIGPIVGYNNSVNVDDVRKYWCELDAINQTKLLFNNLSNSANLTIANSVRAAELAYGTPGEMDPRDKAHQQSRIRSIKSQEAILRQQVLNHVRQFGSTFNCIPGLTERLLNQSWNSVWQSSSNGLNTGDFGQSLDCLGGGASFSSLWSRMIQNNFNDAMGFISDYNNRFTTPSLDISSLQEDFVIIPVDDKKEPFADRPVKASKVFAKCDADKIIFMNISSFTDPRVIVKTPLLTVADSSASYAKDPGLTVIANIAIEDLLIYTKLHPNGAALLEDLNSTSNTTYNKEVEYLRLLKRYIVPELAPNFLITTGSSANPSSVEHDFCAPRAAHPHFFAIPLKSNQFCYGPWVNFPDLVIRNNNIINNNMIHKIKVEQNNDLVPWNYGNASLLDSAAYAMIGGDAHYQTILENGSISMIGMPVFGIGGSLSSFVRDNRRNFAFVYDNNYYSLIFNRQKLVDIKLNGQAGSITNTIHYNIFQLQHNVVGLDGPIISNITLQVGNDSVVTNYRFQTYNPRTGLYNKEYTDALREQATENNKFRKAIANLNNSISTKITREINQIFDRAKENRTPTNISKVHTRLFGNSPTELIVGQARELLKDPGWYSGPPINQIADSGDRPLNVNIGNENDAQAHEKFLNNKIHHHWAGIVIGDESLAELKQDFDCKSAMSLDGLLSPVSLYPTRDSATYHISTYLTGSGINVGGLQGGKCPLCGNNRSYPMQFLSHKFGLTSESSTPINIPCPVCNKSKLEININDKNPNDNNGLPDINYRTLSPILISQGEFRNPYASGIDRCRDSINVVSAGKLPPTNRDQWTPSNRNKYARIGRDLRNPDYSQYDSINGINESERELLNKRFFALRGPLMMHGWGYDVDGYPIPNALDMPYHVDIYGRPLRFKVIEDINNKKFGLNNLDSPGFHFAADGAFLGDIITHRYEWTGSGSGIGTGTGRWKKKSKPSKKFYLNWAERPDVWPVGPIDLRWDAKRRVWEAAGGCKEEILPPFIISNKNDPSTLTEFLENRSENKCTFRNVHITLENDMVKEINYDSTYPTLAIIDDVEYSREPLQSGYRRLVYVVDKTGYTAPKGTRLLCRYDRLSGFYEPQSKPLISAVGTISNGRAVLENIAQQGRRSGTTVNYNVSYINPLGFSPINGNKGIFMFINNQWTLSSCKS